MKRVSLTDIAARAGVSKNTVSLALRHDPQIPLRTRRRIEKLAAEMGYAKNPVVSELMARLRRGGGQYRETLALVNGSENPRAFLEHPTIPLYVEGCRSRAANLGYTLDEFWLHDPSLRGAGLVRVLEARGIRGVLVVGLMKTNRLPEHFLPVVERFPVVVTGVRTRDPALSFACVDHYILTLRAVERVIELGYRRPALVIDPVIDDLVDGRFSAGFRQGVEKLPARQRISPFFRLAEATSHPEVFTRWLKAKQPDVVFALYHSIVKWLSKAGLHVPRDLGLVQLEWRRDRPEVSGMNQHNEITGESAVNMLIGMIHNGESGIPEFPRSTMIDAVWVEGRTVLARER